MSMLRFIRKLYRKHWDFPRNWGRYGWEWEDMKDWDINGEAV